MSWYSKNHQQLEDKLKDEKKMISLLSFVEDTEVISSTKDASHPPPILELGTFRAGTTIFISKFLMMIDSKRKLITCDTFSGFPYADTTSTKVHNEMYNTFKSGLEKTSYDYVNKKYKLFEVEKYIETIVGRFEDTLYQKLNDKKFSFVFSDSDLYKSTAFSLEFLKTRMCKNGIIAFHNYGELDPIGIWGETDAVDEFCQKNKMKLNTEKSIPYLKF
jgi:hypothetical protein